MQPLWPLGTFNMFDQNVLKFLKIHFWQDNKKELLLLGLRSHHIFSLKTGQTQFANSFTVNESPKLPHNQREDDSEKTSECWQDQFHLFIHWETSLKNTREFPDKPKNEQEPKVLLASCTGFRNILISDIPYLQYI